MITIEILGCGTSSGVPLLLCDCKVCSSKNPKNNRLRASVWIQTPKKSFLIDTSTDLRQQALRAKISRIDAILYTHPHADHTGGIDEIRSFNYIQETSIPAYAHSWTYEDLPKRFPYIFSGIAAEGGGIPQIELHLIDPYSPSLEILGESIIPLPVSHGSKISVGYRIGNFAYVTDCSFIASETLNKMKNLSVLVLDCVRFKPHRTHFNLTQALDTIAALKPEKAYLTHLGHDFDYEDSNKLLPKNVFFAYDGLKIHL